LINEGLVSPGNSPGSITVDGDFVQTETGRLLIEIGGAATEPGTDFDALVVTGSATFDGTLELETLEDFAGELGDSFEPIRYGSASGTFAAVRQPLNADVVFDPVLGATGVETTLTEQDGEVFVPPEDDDDDEPFDPENPPVVEDPDEAREIADDLLCADERDDTEADNDTSREQQNLDTEDGEPPPPPDATTPPGGQGVGCVTG
jgi:hypothetical protein